MSHDHSHKCQCKHDHLKYCARCYVVHCLDCKSEWATPCLLNHYSGAPYYTHYTPWTLSGGLSTSGASSSFTIANDDAHSLTCSH